MRKPVFEGTATALVTPMYQNGALNLEKLAETVERQIALGIDALVPCGTTGESATLSDKEKEAVIRTTVEVAAGRVPVIAGAGSNDTDHAAANCRAAKSAGADALLLVTPYYNKCTPKGLQAHFIRLAEAADLPVILYNVPSRTGVNIDLESRIVLSRHPNIVGIKEAGTDLSLASKTVAACGEEFALYSGNDDLTLAMMALGAKGAVSVVSNVFPAEEAALTRFALQGDYTSAKDLYYSLLPAAEAFFCEVNPIPVKAAMAMIGYDCGPCRMPLSPLEESHYTLLQHCIAILPKQK